MKRSFGLMLVVVLFLAATAVGWFLIPSSRPVSAETETAFTALQNADGTIVGTASFFETVMGEVRVVVEVNGLSTGLHGFHIHAVGRCDPADFVSAGSHFNPASKLHGLQSSGGPHAGDLPNLVVDASGRGRLDRTFAHFTLSAGATSILDADSSALVIHALPDDGITDPIGNSGARIACGVIQRRTAGAAVQTSPTPASGVTPPRTGDGGLLAGDAAIGSAFVLVGVATLVVTGGFAWALLRKPSR